MKSIPSMVTAIRLGLIEPKGSMRNLTCVCGSGTKFKKCCYNKLKAKHAA